MKARVHCDGLSDGLTPLRFISNVELTFVRLGALHFDGAYILMDCFSPDHRRAELDATMHCQRDGFADAQRFFCDDLNLIFLTTTLRGFQLALVFPNPGECFPETRRGHQ
jgi:hypothetical protein